jgi:hypothetical protein
VGTAAGCSPGGSGGSTPTAAAAGAAPRPSAASPPWEWLGPLTIW